ncbi:DUF938 domain-containing protein [Vibrio sp. EA2]|uniref:DUF938 domain-containing protein n=1 Tax=Vibrio sp. EA2 TaxID=3079860 RepID=UPI002949574C|nr:DUF938 domain-containing protein [Vibrio sp. EA2]MDV6251197.1 DUF938 domain-containing protein [Vibrio sp. EA2]
MTQLTLPHCERNKHPILEQLLVHFKSSQHVLEIGSGNGQHAVFFAEHLPHLTWYTSEMPENHAGIHNWLHHTSLPNIVPPLEFTIGEDPWPKLTIDAVFTANTTHIMQPEEAKQMMKLISFNLPENGIFCQYGPMKVDGKFTSSSNQEFDRQLKQNGFGGIQDINDLASWADNLTLIEKVPMPANNFLLVWKA